MSITLISNADLGDIKSILGRLLAEGIQSPSVRRLAETAIFGSNDPLASIFHFVRTTFPYVPDPSWGNNGELFIHPNRVAEDYYAGRLRGGDCDDHSLLCAAMAGSIGYQVRIALVDSSMDGALDHAVAQVFSEILGEFISVDTTSSLPLGWKSPSGKATYVQPSD